MNMLKGGAHGGAPNGGGPIGGGPVTVGLKAATTKLKKMKSAEARDKTPDKSSFVSRNN